MSLPQGSVGWMAVCDCGNYYSSHILTWSLLLFYMCFYHMQSFRTPLTVIISNNAKTPKCCVVVTMEVEVTSLQGMMGILRNSCIRKKDGDEVSYSGCDAKNRNDSY